MLNHVNLYLGMNSQTAKLQSQVRELISDFVQSVCHNNQNYFELESHTIRKYCIISCKIRKKTSQRHYFKGVIKISSHKKQDVIKLEQFFKFLESFS